MVVLAVNAVVIQTVLTEESMVKQLVRVGVLAVATLSLVQRNTWIPKWLAMLCLWSLILLTATQNPDQLSVVFVLVLSVWLKMIPERSVLRAVAIASVVALALIFALLLAGITQDEILELRSRRTFGTAGVPFFFNVVFGAAALSILYAVRHRGRTAQRVVLLVALVAATWLFGQTDARGGYAALLLFVALLWVVPRARLTPIYAAVPAFLMVASLYLAYRASPELNSTLSQRPKLYRTFLDQRDFADLFFSTSAKQAGFAVDNSYLHLLIGTGIITAAVFVVLFWRAVHNLMDRRRYAEVAFLLAASAYCVSESLLVRIENPFIIYVWFLVVRYGTPLLGHEQREEQLERSRAKALA